jgi:hypothetical protein
MAMPMLCFQPLVARRIAANIAKLPELLARVDRDCAELDYRQTNAVRTVLHSRLDQCPRATHLFAHPALQLGCLLTHIRLHF